MSRALAVERATAKVVAKEAREAVTAAITAAAKAATQAAAEAVAAEKAAAKAAKAFESKKRLRVVQIADQARFSEQALPGEVEAWRQASVPRLLRHGRGGGAVLCAVAGGAGGCGGGSSAATATANDSGGGGAAGGGGGADAAEGRHCLGLQGRVLQQRQDQALPGAGAACRQESAPRLLRHGRGGGAVLCADAGGAGGCGDGSSAATATANDSR